jgi:hypothetical protein
MRWWIPLLAACAGAGSTTPPEPLSDCASVDGDDFVYTGGASIDGDTLSVPVSFGGGCETHTLVVCWPSQTVLDASPQQVELEVWHDGNGDSCEAALDDVATVDLTPLQGGAASPVEIRIGDETVTYTY